MTTPDWDALATAVKARRERLRVPQDLVDLGGPGEMTMRKIERAEAASLRNRTKGQLEWALDWPAGLVDRILDGTATQEDIDSVVVRDKGRASLSGLSAVVNARKDPAAAANLGRLDAQLPGLQASATGNVTRHGRDDEHAIFRHASALVPLLARRAPSSKASRAAVTVLIDVMGELAGEMVQPGDTITIDGEDYHT
jgi:hypothetical protein